MAGEANIWNPRTLIEVSADTKSVEESITATSGQSLFTLTDFVYSVGTGALTVYKNGLLLAKGIDWAEQTASTFSLVIPCVAGDRIVAKGDIGITGTVDVRDTDIFVANRQAIRDYAGTETTLYSQGGVTQADGGESMYNKVTGMAVGFFVDNSVDILVPTGGDGSIGWVADNDRAVYFFATMAEAAASPNKKKLKVGNKIVIGDRNNSIFDVKLASSVTPNTYQTVVCTKLTTLALDLDLAHVQHVNVAAFGANGISDDTGAWDAAIAYINTVGTANPLKLVAPNWQHQLPNGVNMYGILYCDIDGNIVANTTADKVIIGSSVVAANPSRYRFASGNCTLEVQGASRMDLQWTRFHEVIAEAENDGGDTKYNISYSNFRGTDCVNFTFVSNTISGITAWQNENRVSGLRVTGTLKITGDYPSNNNIFSECKFESCTIIIDSASGSLGAHHNIFKECRFEGDMTITFGALTEANKMYVSWANFSFVGYVGRFPGTLTLTNNGRDTNEIISEEHKSVEVDMMYDLTAFSANYKWETFERVGHQLKIKNNNLIFFDTDLVPLDHSVWFLIEADSDSFKYFVELFDDTGNRLYTETTGAVQAGMTWKGTPLFHYSFGADVGNGEIAINKTTGVGFFRLYGTTGTSALNDLFSHFRLRSIQMKKGSRDIPLMSVRGGVNNFVGEAVPTAGTFRVGQRIDSIYPAAAAPAYWVCTGSGTFGTATDSTGDTTSGSNVITGMTDTSDFFAGDFVSASVGFTPNANGLKIQSVDSATQITLDQNATSTQSNITVATVNPTFAASANLV